MEMNFEFTDVRADRSQDHRPAVADVQSGDVDRQADVGQHLHGATDAATLDGERDHGALHQQVAAERDVEAGPAGNAADVQPARHDVRPAVRVRYVDASDEVDNPGPVHLPMPAGRPESVGFYGTRHPDHVRVFYLDTEGGDGSSDQHRDAADETHGDRRGYQHEVSHDGTESTTRRFATDASGEVTAETGDANRVHEAGEGGQAAADGVTAQEAGETAEDEGDGKSAFSRALSGVLRVTGRVISDTSHQALEAYRQGPGERMLEDQLERRAERVGNQAVRDQVKEAKRGAPLLERRYAANNVKYHAGEEIKRRAKQAYKNEVRASWREMDEQAGGAADDHDA